MNVLYIAVPVAVGMGAAALLACIYCITHGQFDDLESPSVRILLDDELNNSSPTIDRK